MDYSSLVEVALDAARAAVAVHRRHLGQVRVEDWSEKGVADFVSHVDRDAEAEIVARIRAACPAHEILAEEAATAPGGAGSGAIRAAEWLWIVDPLDGTTNYLHGFPAFSASIAVAHRGELVAAAVVHGTTGQAFTATRGGGAFRDGEAIRVSRVEQLRLASIGTGFPYRYVESIPAYLRQIDAVMRHAGGVRRPGSAALDLCHVACGQYDAFWEQRLAPWDVAAGTLIVREAGGLVTDLAGDPAAVLAGGAILAGNPALHAQLRSLLAGTETPGAAPGYAAHTPLE